MADISVEKKTGSDLTWMWALGAVIAVIALMAWLYSTRSDATTDAATDTVAEVPAAETVELAAIGAGPDQYAGRTVRVENVPVAVALGNRSFWAEVTGANPLLVVVGPEVADVSWIAPGTTANLQGTVQPVTEEALDQWIADGQTMQADAREQASFATHYFSVSQAEAAQAAPAQ